MTPEFVEAVAPVVRWALVNGWERDVYPRHYHSDEYRVIWDGGWISIRKWMEWGSFIDLGGAWVTSPQQAIDVLAALGVLPARFSSQWQAGRDVALEAVAANVMLPYDLPPGVQDVEARREALRAELAAVYMTPDVVTDQATGYAIGQRSHV